MNLETPLFILLSASNFSSTLCKALSEYTYCVSKVTFTGMFANVFKYFLWGFLLFKSKFVTKRDRCQD